MRMTHKQRLDILGWAKSKFLSFEQIQGVDLVEGVKAGVMVGIADVIRFGQISEAISTAGERIVTLGRMIGGDARGDRLVLDSNEIRAVVDRKLDVVSLAAAPEGLDFHPDVEICVAAVGERL